MFIATITIIGLLLSGARNTFSLIDKVENIDLVLEEQNILINNSNNSFKEQLNSYQAATDLSIQNLHLTIESQSDYITELEEKLENRISGNGYWLWQIETRICNAKNTIRNELQNKDHCEANK
jgi:hypothetical protein|tara:strand:+ start:920 stop:1288 length:369 start_codon:yes stop_codon:yes gene_type:complete